MLEQGHAQLGFDKPSQPPSELQEYLLGYAKSKVLFTAIRLRIFDALAGRPMTVEELAEILGFSAQAGERLLVACTTLGFLEWDGQRYHNSEQATRYFLTGGKDSIVAIALHADSVQYPLWQHLTHAIQENHIQSMRAFGRDSSILGDDFFQNEHVARRFLEAMHWRSVIASQAELAALHLDATHHLLDIGGGTGAFCTEAVRRYPHISATIMDLPHICPITEEYLRKANVSERVQVSPGNAFTSDLPGQPDTVVMTLFLHDWSESQQRLLLKKVRDILPSGGRCIIAERFLPENKRGDVRAVLMNINMLLATGGIEHTASDWTTLLKQSGFEDVEAIPLPQSSRDLLVATVP